MDEISTIAPLFCATISFWAACTDEERPAQVRVDHRVPVVVRHLVEQVVADDPGAGDEDVEPPRRRRRLGHCRLDLLARGHVALHGATADRGRRLLRRCEIEVRDDDVGSLCGEPGRGGGADPARAAGDEGHLPGEAVCDGHAYLRITSSATQTGLSPPSRSIVVTATICSAPGTSSTEATVTRARIRDPTGTGAGNRTLLVP